jgi:hypothetical protein
VAEGKVKIRDCLHQLIVMPFFPSAAIICLSGIESEPNVCRHRVEATACCINRKLLSFEQDILTLMLQYKLEDEQKFPLSLSR